MDARTQKKPQLLARSAAPEKGNRDNRLGRLVRVHFLLDGDRLRAGSHAKIPCSIFCLLPVREFEQGEIRVAIGPARNQSHPVVWAQSTSLAEALSR